VITKPEKYQTFVETFTERQDATLRACTHCFIYCLNADVLLSSQDNSINITLNAGHLIQLSQPDAEGLQINGKNMIVIYLEEIT